MERYVVVTVEDGSRRLKRASRKAKRERKGPNRGWAATSKLEKSSKWVAPIRLYKRLRDFRAGIEGNISFLKRIFGLDRCTWKSWSSFQSYVWGSILSFNLLVLARHLLS